MFSKCHLIVLCLGCGDPEKNDLCGHPPPPPPRPWRLFQQQVCPHRTTRRIPTPPFVVPATQIAALEKNCGTGIIFRIIFSTCTRSTRQSLTGRRALHRASSASTAEIGKNANCGELDSVCPSLWFHNHGLHASAAPAAPPYGGRR